MSPEQARGRSAAERSDVWAFGCVLYEMLSGQQPFKGDSVADVIDAVVHNDPDWHALPPNTPPAVLALIKGYLEKEWRRRYHAIGDVRIELERIQSAPAGTEGTYGYPFWSPDSRYIGFFAGGKLRKVAVAGGPPQVLCDAPFVNSGGGTRQAERSWPWT